MTFILNKNLVFINSMQFMDSSLEKLVKNLEVRRKFRHWHVLIIEKGLRGGICGIAKRYSEANNKYMKNYDPTKSSGFMVYLDKNNMYDWAVSGYLPYGGFKWLKNVDNFDINSISENSPKNIFSKLILNILMNYMYYTMIIH